MLDSWPPRQVSFLDQFFSEWLLAILPMPPTVLRVLRVARVLRILRLLKNLKGLRDLVMTLVFSIPALINVGCLLALVIFCLLYTSPSPRDRQKSRMPSSA